MLLAYIAAVVGCYFAFSKLALMAMGIEGKQFTPLPGPVRWTILLAAICFPVTAATMLMLILGAL